MEKRETYIYPTNIQQPYGSTNSHLDKYQTEWKTSVQVY